jgi:APA family basic amino acid/polyamine antiporter
MPIGILGSLVICTILYVLFSYVLSGVATVQDFRSHGREASVAFAITKYMTGYEWLSKSVTVAILAGFSSVILVMLLGQSRVFYSMSRDGLVPKTFSDVHPKFRTPYKSNILFFLFTGVFGAFIPEDIVGEMTSIGTLFAFMLVCAGVWILARLASRSGTCISGTGGAGCFHARHHRLRRDDLWSRLDELDAVACLACDWTDLLF